MLPLSDLCQQVVPLVRQTGDFISKYYGQVGRESIELKSFNSLVSFVDKEAETQLVKGLSDLLPDSAFLTEEDTVTNGEATYRWIIDPLDGTTNFLHGIPFFSVSVALEHKGEWVLGVVHEVMRKETFYAWKNGGAFLNDEPIKVSEHTLLSDTLIATGFPYHDYSGMEPYLKVFTEFMQSTRGLRRLGSAALDLAYVACGRFDAFFEYSLNPWDVAGGAVIVKEAGGTVTDFLGGDQYLLGQEILAGRPEIHMAMQDILVRHFYPKERPLNRE